MDNGMTVKDWLGRGIGIELRIRSLERSKEKSYSMVTSAVAQASGDMVSHSGVSRPSEEYSLLSAEVDEQLHEWDAVTAEITKAIGRIGNHVYAALLQNRYVVGMSWEQIADEIGYSDDYVKHGLFERAITAFEAVMKKDT